MFHCKSYLMVFFVSYVVGKSAGETSTSATTESPNQNSTIEITSSVLNNAEITTSGFKNETSSISTISPVNWSNVSVGEKTNLVGFRKCDSNKMCQELEGTYCKEGLCQCLESHLPAYSSLKCLKKASSVNESCEIDEQCFSVAASCQKGFCTKTVVTAQLNKLGVQDTVAGVTGSSLGNTLYRDVFKMSTCILVLLLSLS